MIDPVAVAPETPKPSNLVFLSLGVYPVTIPSCDQLGEVFGTPAGTAAGGLAAAA